MLPEAERRVIVLLYRERRTTAEIAADLGRSEGAVRALHQRAVRRLRERFGERLTMNEREPRPEAGPVPEGDAPPRDRSRGRLG